MTAKKSHKSSQNVKKRKTQEEKPVVEGIRRTKESRKN